MRHIQSDIEKRVRIYNNKVIKCRNLEDQSKIHINENLLWSIYITICSGLTSNNIKSYMLGVSFPIVGTITYAFADYIKECLAYAEAQDARTKLIQTYKKFNQ